MKHNELLLIKLGGSVITDKKKPFTERRGVIGRLGREIMDSFKKFKGNIIIVHGQGSFAHIPASKYKTQKGIINKQSFRGLSEVADAAIEINRIVMDVFLKIGLKAISFAPASIIVSKNEKPYSVFIEPLKRSLELGFIPVLYGDIVFDIRKRGFCIYSGEKIIGALVKKLYKYYKKVRIIYCADSDGVYDEKGKTIPLINRKVIKKISGLVKASDSVDVTGGMLHKVKESLEVAGKYKITTYIINGLRRNNLFNIVTGNKLGVPISQIS
jgi:isopentenyl phosphate kinase